MQSNIRLAIDVDGGDVPANLVLDACKGFAQSEHVHLFLCGQEDIISKSISNWGDAKKRVTVVPSVGRIDMDTEPAVALRRIKDSSMHHCIKLHKSGEVDAVVSAGNTGALVALSTVHLGLYSSVRRPAICTQLPSQSGPFLMLDLGACVECKASDLVSFAHLAAELAKSLDYENQKIALLNVGHESIKGNQLVKETAKLLDGHDHFIGFVEPTDLFKREADIIVTDGFSGNLVLKSIEGTMKFLLSLIKKTVLSSIVMKLLSPLVKIVLSRALMPVHPDQYNGAVLLGVRGIVVKSHGMTSIEGYRHAIREALLLVEHDFVKNTNDSLAAISDNIEV